MRGEKKKGLIRKRKKRKKKKPPGTKTVPRLGREARGAISVFYARSLPSAVRRRRARPRRFVLWCTTKRMLPPFFLLSICVLRNHAGICLRHFCFDAQKDVVSRKLVRKIRIPSRRLAVHKALSQL